MRYEGKLQFTRLIGEISRQYAFSVDGKWEFVNFYGVTHLHAGKNGHRLYCEAEKESHYVPKGWLTLTWVVEDGAPNFTL